MERTRSRSDIPHEKMNWEFLPKSLTLTRSINLNRQPHKIVTYYWFRREDVKDLTAVMLFSLINVLALFHPIATLIWTQMLPAPLKEAEHTSWGWNITFQNSQEPKNSLHVFFFIELFNKFKVYKNRKL